MTVMLGGFRSKAESALRARKRKEKKNDFVHRSQTAKKIESKKKKVLFGSNFFFLSILELFFSRTRRQSLPLGRFRRGRATQKVDQAKTAARTRP